MGGTLPMSHLQPGRGITLEYWCLALPLLTAWLCCLQGAVGFGEPQPLVPYAYERHGWLAAVQVGTGMMADSRGSCIVAWVCRHGRWRACLKPHLSQFPLALHAAQRRVAHARAVSSWQNCRALRRLPSSRPSGMQRRCRVMQRRCRTWQRCGASAASQRVGNWKDRQA